MNATNPHPIVIWMWRSTNPETEFLLIQLYSILGNPRPNFDCILDPTRCSYSHHVGRLRRLAPYLPSGKNGVRRREIFAAWRNIPGLGFFIGLAIFGMETAIDGIELVAFSVESIELVDKRPFP